MHVAFEMTEKLYSVFLLDIERVPLPFTKT